MIILLWLSKMLVTVVSSVLFIHCVYVKRACLKGKWITRLYTLWSHSKPNNTQFGNVFPIWLPKRPIITLDNLADVNCLHWMLVYAENLSHSMFYVTTFVIHVCFVSTTRTFPKTYLSYRKVKEFIIQVQPFSNVNIYRLLYKWLYNTEFFLNKCPDNYHIGRADRISYLHPRPNIFRYCTVNCIITSFLYPTV